MSFDFICGSVVRNFVVSLRLYQTIPCFHDPTNVHGFRKPLEKSRKCCQPIFSPFTTMVSTLYIRIIIMLDTFELSFANRFDLYQSIILLFGKDLKKR